MRPQLRFPRRALAWGAGHLAVALLVLAWADPAAFGWFAVASLAPLAVATALGVFWVGASVGALYEEFGLVTPAVVVTAAFALTAFPTLASRGAPVAFAGPSYFDLYLGYWFVVLALALLVGGAEYLLRGRTFPRVGSRS